MDPSEFLRRQIADLVTAYHAEAFAPAPFVPGESPVPVSGKVFDDDEMRLLVDASLDFWLTRPLRERVRAPLRQALSASATRCSATAARRRTSLAVSRADLAEARRAARCKPGDEVITVAAGFPTTVNPILQNGARPGLRRRRARRRTTSTLDAPRRGALGAARRGRSCSPTRSATRSTSARSRRSARSTTCGSIEDNCDALGARYDGQLTSARSATSRRVSFYPAHHITMGEGGAVLTASGRCSRRSSSRFRDWGRDCWCEPGKENTCGKRFDWQLGELPVRLRPQVHLLAPRLQPEGDRHAGGRRRRAARQARRRSSQARTAQLAARCTTGCADLEELLILPEATPRQRAELVRLRARPSGPRRRSRAASSSRTSRSARSPRGCCSAATCCASPPTATSRTASSAS